MALSRLIHVDTDALIQVFITDSVDILRALKTTYGFQPVIAPEVEIEILSSRKFAGRFSHALRKAISAGTLVVLDAAGFASLLATSSELRSAAVGVSFADIQSLGATYNRRVDRGESYTFAAAVKLGQPAVSNDMSALTALDQAGCTLPPTVLRAYDLFIFAYQVSLYTETRCDDLRKALLAERSEFIPGAFKNSSFQDGLRKFTPRLVDTKKAEVGRSYSGPQRFDTPFYINL